MYIYSLLWVRHCPRRFTFSLTLSPKHYKKQFYRWRNWSSERLANLLMVTQLSRGRAKFQPSSDWPPNSCSVYASCFSSLSNSSTYRLFFAGLHHIASSMFAYVLKVCVYVFLHVSGSLFPLWWPIFVKGWTPEKCHQYLLISSDVAATPSKEPSWTHFLCSQRFLHAGQIPAKMAAPAPGIGGDPSSPAPVLTSSRGNSVK